MKTNFKIEFTGINKLEYQNLVEVMSYLSNDLTRKLIPLENRPKPAHALMTVEDQEIGRLYDAKKRRKNNSILKEPLTNYMFTIRTLNCIDSVNPDKSRQIYGEPKIEWKVKNLLQWTIDDLMKIRNMGKKSVNEIRMFLATHGYKLKDDNFNRYN